MAKRIHVSNGAIVATAESTVQLMKDVKKIPTLSKEAEFALADRIQAGDQRAINELVSANIRFAIHLAKQYQGMGLELEDLIGFANIGLFEAAERYRSDKQVKFITFAVHYMRAELQKALNDLSRTVRIPSHRTKTEEYSTKSISTPVGEDENKETYADRYLVADAVKGARELQDLHFDLSRALGQLKPKQAEALVRNYGIGMEYAQSMEQIGEEMGITNERARQLVRQAEEALKSLPGIELLEQYL